MMAESSNDYVVLVVRENDQQLIKYRIKKNSRLEKLMEFHQKRFDLDATTVRFYTDSGHRLCGVDTPASLNLENGDEIELAPFRCCKSVC